MDYNSSEIRPAYPGRLQLWTERDANLFLEAKKGVLSAFTRCNCYAGPARHQTIAPRVFCILSKTCWTSWAYTSASDQIQGFKQTHKPSLWMNDYGQFSIMPVTGKIKFKEDEKSSWFSHKAETSKPYYYRVYLADADVTTEITPSERAAQFHFTFPSADSSFIVVDAFDRGSYVKIIPAERKIAGYSTRHSRGPLKSFKTFQVIMKGSI